VRSNAIQVRSTTELHCVSVRALSSHTGKSLVFAGAFERNTGTFNHRATLRLCQGLEFARRHAIGVRRCVNVLE
jgi:hypothetical protein